MEKSVPKKVAIFQEERAKSQVAPFSGLGFQLKQQDADVRRLTFQDLSKRMFSQGGSGGKE